MRLLYPAVKGTAESAAPESKWGVNMAGPAVAQSVSDSGSEDVPFAVTLKGTDSGAGAMTFLLTDLPLHGTLFTSPGGVQANAGTYYQGTFNAVGGYWEVEFQFVPAP